MLTVELSAYWTVVSMVAWKDGTMAAYSVASMVYS